MDLPVQFDSVFFEKSRLSILTLMYQEGEVTYSYLKETLKYSDGALYSHLQKLTKQGYVTSKKKVFMNSAHTVYRMSPKGESEYIRYLEYLERFLRSIRKGEKDEQH